MDRTHGKTGVYKPERIDQNLNLERVTPEFRKCKKLKRKRADFTMTEIRAHKKCLKTPRPEYTVTRQRIYGHATWEFQ